MTDLASILNHARALELTEDSVETPAITTALSELREEIAALTGASAEVAMWLQLEHTAGSMIAIAATMNKRGEQAGKPYPFEAGWRAQIIDRYNMWAHQFVTRINDVMANRGDIPAYTRKLQAFRDDTVNRTP